MLLMRFITYWGKPHTCNHGHFMCDVRPPQDSLLLNTNAMKLRCTQDIFVRVFINEWDSNNHIAGRFGKFTPMLCLCLLW